MFINRCRQKAGRLLQTVDVRVDGNRPWDLKVQNPRFFPRLFAQGSMGLGESYMDGWWDCERLDQFFFHVLRGKLEDCVHPLSVLPTVLLSRLFNFQKPSRSKIIAEKHYNIGNDLFACMLDRNLNYSCGYWAAADDLEQAQERKLALIFRKLGLKPGMRVLDIGCGWGAAAKLAAARYGVEVVGITVSDQQAGYAREACRDLPVEIRLQDYRRLNETFDRIFSIGMFEHVGYKNYRLFFKTVKRCLAPEGLFLLHTIGNNQTGTTTDPWINRYIFPNSMLPSVRQIAAAAEGFFVMEDWHGLGPHYDKTLMQWYQNFNASWENLKDAYGSRFYRKWKYYLLSCAGAFRARSIQVWQVLFSHEGILGDFEVVR